MRLIRFQIFGLLCVLASIADAQTHADLARCRAITEDSRRLECYDNIPGADSSVLSKYEAVPLEDFQAFALSYRGRFVELRGTMKLFEDYATIGRNSDDADAVPVEIENLSREELRAIREACPDACDATVSGRASPLRFTTGVIADAVVVR